MKIKKPYIKLSLPEKVYYGSYASNTDEERFGHYIAGGRYKHSLQALPGCTDQTPPSDVQAFILPWEMYFGGYSHSWDGGTAYINPGKSGSTLAVAHLITREQFWQVVAQESLSNAGKLAGVLPEHLPTDSSGISGTGNYDYMLLGGELNGWPIVTFTSPVTHEKPSKPTEAYLQTIAGGLAAKHRIGPKEISEYFGGLAGVKGEYLQQDVESILRTALSVGPLITPQPAI